MPKFSEIYTIYSILRSYAEQNRINRNFSQNRHNLKTLLLVYMVPVQCLGYIAKKILDYSTGIGFYSTLRR